MSTIRFIPSSIATHFANSNILCIYVSAHPATAIGALGVAGNPKTNHWVFYCAISQTESLCIDPSPSGPNLSIVSIITKKDYLYSNNAVKTFQLVIRTWLSSNSPTLLWLINTISISSALVARAVGIGSTVLLSCLSHKATFPASPRLWR